MFQNVLYDFPHHSVFGQLDVFLKRYGIIMDISYSIVYNINNQYVITLLHKKTIATFIGDLYNVTS